MRWLADAGFAVVPSHPPAARSKLEQGNEQLRAEIDRLQDAKRRALQLADERAKEATELRLENERLRAQLAEARP